MVNGHSTNVMYINFVHEKVDSPLVFSALLIYWEWKVDSGQFSSPVYLTCRDFIPSRKLLAEAD